MKPSMKNIKLKIQKPQLKNKKRRKKKTQKPHQQNRNLLRAIKIKDHIGKLLKTREEKMKKIEDKNGLEMKKKEDKKD